MIDDKTFNQVAQAGHFAGGSAIVLAVVVVTHEHAWAVLWGFLLVAALAGFKEFWWDEHYETAEVRGNGLEDFTFYMIGASAAALVAILFR
jgi:hypothetical protein